MSFEDNYSTQSAEYARHRPTYPDAIFEELASLAPGRRLAWDCATGNGQAATGLASRFEHVIASDASEEQIRNAIQHERVEYRVATAEASGIAENSVDLITVAQAVHWFDLDRFYDEVYRVLVPGGVLAVWGYTRSAIVPGIESILRDFYLETLRGFWSPRIDILEDQYRSIPFPFDELQPPVSTIVAEWSADDMLGYLESWSAVQAYIREHGVDPTSIIADDLRAAWGDERRTVRWPLYFRIGRVVETTTGMRSSRTQESDT